MIEVMPGIASLRLFGSVARGDGDELSDIDILAVQRRSLTEPERQVLVDRLTKLLRGRLSISWYGEQKLREMYGSGDLFAWHLHKESRKLFAHRDFLDDLFPARYTDAARDIASFRRIVAGAAASIRATTRNAAYEAGLLFLCTRNVAMCASAHFKEGPFFGRRSPFQLERKTGIQFPLSSAEHDLNMQCRALGHRGERIRDVDGRKVAEMAHAISRWCQDVSAYVEEATEVEHA